MVGTAGEKAGKQIKRARGVSVFASPGRHKSSHNNSDTAAQGPGDNTPALGMGPTAERRGRGSRTPMHNTRGRATGRKII